MRKWRRKLGTRTGTPEGKDFKKAIFFGGFDILIWRNHFLIRHFSPGCEGWLQIHLDGRRSEGACQLVQYFCIYVSYNRVAVSSNTNACMYR